MQIETGDITPIISTPMLSKTLDSIFLVFLEFGFFDSMLHSFILLLLLLLSPTTRFYFQFKNNNHLLQLQMKINTLPSLKRRRKIKTTMITVATSITASSSVTEERFLKRKRIWLVSREKVKLVIHLV